MLGRQNAFMNCWWLSVHSYCWTCGFRGPLGAQGTVGCPLATTHVNHFLRGFVGVTCFKGGFVRCAFFVRRGFLGVDCLGVDFGMELYSTAKPPNRCGRMHQQIHFFLSTPKSTQKIHTKSTVLFNPKDPPVLLTP